MKKERYTIITRGSIDPEYIQKVGISHEWDKQKDCAWRFLNDRQALDYLQKANIDNASIEHVYESRTHITDTHAKKRF